MFVNVKEKSNFLLFPYNRKLTRTHTQSCKKLKEKQIKYKI